MDLDKLNEKLEPCPFCGELAGVGILGGKFFIACTHCPACFPPNGMELEELIKCWNERAKDT